MYGTYSSNKAAFALQNNEVTYGQPLCGSCDVPITHRRNSLEIAETAESVSSASESAVNSRVDNFACTLFTSDNNRKAVSRPEKSAGAREVDSIGDNCAVGDEKPEEPGVANSFCVTGVNAAR